MSRKIFITQRIPDQGPTLLLEKLGADDIEYNETDGVLPKEELIKRLQGKDIVLSLLTDTIDEELFDACPDLKMVANYAVGFNNIDLEAAKKRGIVVTNTPGVLDQTTADLAFALIMACGRELLPADEYMRSGKYKNWEPMGFLGQDIFNSTLGIIGMGRIGKAVAERGVKGFNMKVVYADEIEAEGLDFDVEKIPLEELLEVSDFVSLHVPLTDDTHHIISDKELELMKDTSYIINTSRGPVIDEKALYEALKTKKIAGAGLDVYELEPEVYPGLSDLKNLIMVPHIGSASWGTRQRMSRLASENIVDWVEGKEPRTRIA
ncbi:2-hydroxyacid dehydrogenase [Patescibacteria group bacterium]